MTDAPGSKGVQPPEAWTVCCKSVRLGPLGGRKARKDPKEGQVLSWRPLEKRTGKRL